VTKIFVIDDDEQLGRSIGRIVQRAGHDHRVVETLRAAEEMLDQFVPDLVIVEIQSGWVSGLTAFRARLNRARGRPIPLIFTIGRRELYKTIASLALPYDDWVGKPLDPEDFVPRIARALLRADLGPTP